MIIKETQKLISAMASQAETRPEGDGWAQLRSLVTHARYAISQLRKDRGHSSVAVRQLVGTFISFAYAYFARFCESLDADEMESEQGAYWRHQAIEVLCNEWELVARLVPAVNDPTVRLLEVLVDEAAPAEDVRPWEGRVITVPHFARHFELVKLKYAPNIALMGVPLYNLHAPWEWCVVWHEMAGHLVEREEVKPVLEEILADKLVYSLWDEWKEAYPEMPEIKPEVSEEVTSEMPKEVRCSPKEWVKELFEDAYGILCLGPAMVRSLESALRQRYVDMKRVRDECHPVPTIRLAVANALLAEMRFADQADPFDPCVQPMAQALSIVFEKYGFVRQPYDDALDDEVTQLKKALGAESIKLPESPSIPALVAAARLAFDQKPSRGLEIAEAVKEAVEKMPGSSIGDAAVALPEDAFSDLLEGKSWRELLSTVFHESDWVSPGEHDLYPQHPTYIDFYAHGRWHYLYHWGHY
jgi:hypothetical protein